MRKFTTLLLTLNFLVALGQEMSTDNQKIVSAFIDCIRKQKIEELSNHVAYPFTREYPLADIKNKQEFQKRYKEVFDENFIKMIVNSKPSKDWSDMGWRGIMLLDGELWLDIDGSLIGVNYQSKFEARKKKELITEEKKNLHESIREFEEPLYILETAKFRIRIDDVGNGNYRYASWSIKSKMSEKPDLVISKGDFIVEGSGGNHRIEFKSGDYIYDCSIIELGEENSPPAILKVYKGEEVILTQNAQIKRN
jgi:hypothetical protein